jgi:plastocyanin
MHRTRIAAVAALAAAASALAGCGGHGGETALKGRVGPGFTISLKTESGQPVESLTAGKQVFEVDDLSEQHNFHLTGPGVDKKTPVDATGTARWTLELKAGTYTFVCDVHKSTMRGSFTVSGG